MRPRGSWSRRHNMITKQHTKNHGVLRCLCPRPQNAAHVGWPSFACASLPWLDITLQIPHTRPEPSGPKSRPKKHPFTRVGIPPMCPDNVASPTPCLRRARCSPAVFVRYLRLLYRSQSSVTSSRAFSPSAATEKSASRGEGHRIHTHLAQRWLFCPLGPESYLPSCNQASAKSPNAP